MTRNTHCDLEGINFAFATVSLYGAIWSSDGEGLEIQPQEANV